MAKTIGCVECKGWIRVLQGRGLSGEPHPDVVCGGCKTNELEVYKALMEADRKQEEYEGYCDAMESRKAEADDY